MECKIVIKNVGKIKVDYTSVLETLTKKGILKG